MEEKIKLIGLRKNEHRSEYIFPKTEEYLKIIRDLLLELGFDTSDISDYFANLIDYKYTDKLNDEGTDGFYSEKYSVDMIYFSKEISLIFNYKEDKQQEIAKVINKFILDEE